MPLSLERDRWPTGVEGFRGPAQWSCAKSSETTFGDKDGDSGERRAPEEWHHDIEENGRIVQVALRLVIVEQRNHGGVKTDRFPVVVEPLLEPAFAEPAKTLTTFRTDATPITVERRRKAHEEFFLVEKKEVIEFGVAHLCSLKS